MTMIENRDLVRRSSATTHAVVEIVVPVYNEADALEASIRRLAAFLDDELPYRFQVTIADNASTDATWTIANRLADQVQGVHVVHLDVELVDDRDLHDSVLGDEVDRARQDGHAGVEYLGDRIVLAWMSQVTGVVWTSRCRWPGASPRASHADAGQSSTTRPWSHPPALYAVRSSERRAGWRCAPGPG